MSPALASADRGRYNYPWPTKPTPRSNSSTLQSQQLHFHPSADHAMFPSDLDAQITQFENKSRPLDAQSIAARLAFDSTNDKPISITSLKHTVPLCLGGNIPSFNLYDPSPGPSSYSSLGSRTFSEDYSTSVPWTSPCISATYSPQPSIPRGSIDSDAISSSDVVLPGSCSLSEVQQFAETDSTTMFDLENVSDHSMASLNMSVPTTCGPFQLAYDSPDRFPGQQLFNAFIPQTGPMMNRRESSHSDGSRQREKMRTRHDSLSVPLSKFTPSRVTKKAPTASRRVSAPMAMISSPVKSVSPPRRTSAVGSNFPCPLAPYGCTSVFGSKNEWKRHVNTQHLRLDMWRCDQCSDRETRPNDFNRKDLFIQHLRRMHHRPSEIPTSSNSKTSKSRSLSNDDADPAVHDAEQRCHIRLRRPPVHSCCLFCPAEFNGHGSWEERMEHIGRHLEQDKKEGREAPPTTEWRHDETVQSWLEVEGLIIRSGSDWHIADGRRN
ncbi:hypothetical protein MBLNU457_g0856t1 [Dothideomycetes sp. NU457]